VQQQVIQLQNYLMLSNLGGRPLLSIPYWEWCDLDYNNKRKRKFSENTEMDDDNVNDENKRKQSHIQQCLQKASFL